MTTTDISQETPPPSETIVIVDDTPANLRLLSSMLTRVGYKVRPSPNGRLAISAVQASHPDLILLDINMPDLNGYEVCELLKADENTRNIPIIFISALDDGLDKVQAFRNGGADYITKPFHIEEVLARVRCQIDYYNLRRNLEQRVAERTAELTELNRAYLRFIPREFLSFLNKKSIVELQLGDQVQREMTVMFSDMRNFTSISEKLTPQENFNFLNSYLRCISPVIRDHGGFIDKYIGDSIMALFPESPEDALKAAISMLKELQAYNQNNGEQPDNFIRIGTGIHTGKLMLGIIGEEERLQGTVISDSVNLAARLENLTKRYGASIIISEETLGYLPDPSAYHTRLLDSVKVKGKTETVLVFEIFNGDPEPLIELKAKTKVQFEEGLYLFFEKKFEDARDKFKMIHTINPRDKAAQLYLELSSQSISHDTSPNSAGFL